MEECFLRFRIAVFLTLFSLYCSNTPVCRQQLIRNHPHNDFRAESIRYVFTHQDTIIMCLHQVYSDDYTLARQKSLIFPTMIW